MTAQATGRIAFQGELGAYSHQACQQSRPDFEAVPSTTFEEVVDKVAKGEVDLGMLAVENSTYGRVADVHSLLPRAGLHIVDEARGDHLVRIDIVVDAKGHAPVQNTGYGAEHHQG